MSGDRGLFNPSGQNGVPSKKYNIFICRDKVIKLMRTMNILYFFEGTPFCPEGLNRPRSPDMSSELISLVKIEISYPTRKHGYPIKPLIMSDIVYFQAAKAVQAVRKVSLHFYIEVYVTVGKCNGAKLESMSRVD
ncbi:hypothetical protein PHYBLDRAFT_172352 [Phycomyces blakesleeanus NRRL 1555(-)]|uniref:Uncharacterized protein n=1 Tax=Phycomyces blakesleeanus (strain ATCC 8743b / DSM 1359 / FGSC 10004 / NBRC 33097 / NRRL 1555) TaxID=763407 RepID=A0A167L6S6_PHYB8|nr:hypothetical protein PHYBLDRAFT_172352 [Phycomyces blakesleeanus NRRL 1555(-)]OAD69719.1 hypothetical protein PHYBLDRAFT_172352 [Phycomyces blakesleeanus NRRL 1555(-)]|eukprot:XP_018287759.1 hypothetical protein PHYBLDRAFT_172352 [Phycomyces blakesleeanus NRRL 1555(-)]